MECGDLSPLWPAAARRRFVARYFNHHWLRQVAGDQSADRSAHSKEKRAALELLPLRVLKSCVGHVATLVGAKVRDVLQRKNRNTSHVLRL